MSTTQTKKRFHVSLPNQGQEILIKLAEQDGVPVARKATELLLESIERHEDDVCSALLEERMNDGTPDSAWIDWEEAKAHFS